MGHVLRLGTVGAAMSIKKDEELFFKIMGHTQEDEQRIIALLRGDISQGSKEGIRAQKVLADLILQGGLTGGIRMELHFLFLPDKPRRVTIKKRGNRMTKHEIDEKAARHVFQYLQAHPGRGHWERATEHAQKQLAKEGIHLSLPTIKRAWGKHRRGEMQTLWGLLPVSKSASKFDT
jgi:hypothetical protein